MTKIVVTVVHGALRCLALLTSDMDDQMVPKIIPVLFPCLYTIVSSPQVDPSLFCVLDSFYKFHVAALHSIWLFGVV